MEFVRFIGWIFTKVYELLDFKILGFPISVINIIIVVTVFAAFISFLVNIGGVTSSTTGIGSLFTLGRKNTELERTREENHLLHLRIRDLTTNKKMRVRGPR